MNKETKFIIKLNSGLIFTSLEKPFDDGYSVSFIDKRGLFKSFSKAEYSPSVEEVFL
jgi:hypothetical protein